MSDRETLEPIGEALENGIVWFGLNPHTFPVGTLFYASSMTTAPVSIPEGCTPADARMLREANHRLAAESHRRATLLQEWLDTELDAQDEEFQPWLDSFTARVKEEIDEAPLVAAPVEPPEVPTPKETK